MERGRGGGALAWLALQRAPGIGPAAMLRLARAFGSPEAALEAPVEELVTRGRLSPAQAEAMTRQRGSKAALAGEAAVWRRQGIRMVTMGDDCYPRSLLDLRSPPPLLYVRGSLTPEDSRAVAIVGTRMPDQAGSALARRFASGLARRGFVTVSGLARGIDTAAHRGALQTKQGRTIAVLGCGLLCVYPPENGVLARTISLRGCLMSEVPPDREVETKFLLMRDRLQAALSRAVIVVQAHAKCGSIVTARHAVRCGRLLYAVPWGERPFSKGWEMLQSLGARPITAESDLDEIALEIEGHETKPRQSRLV